MPRTTEITQLGHASEYAAAHRARFVAELKNFVCFASVGAQPEHANDLKQCAAWLVNRLGEVGLKHVNVLASQRNPIIDAECARGIHQRRSSAK
jgi:acetylornithine deacetylase/succinyl-diaminopimelate desuccinylase-like protein